MHKLSEYIEFLSDWHVVFTVANSEFPLGTDKDKEGNQFEDIEWECVSINDITLTKFEKIIHQFGEIVQQLNDYIEGKIVSVDIIPMTENWIVVRRKVQILINKFNLEPWQDPDPVRSYISHKCYFEIGEGLEVEQNFYDDYGIQINRRFQKLITYSKEYLTLYFWPFRKDLEKLLPVLDYLAEHKEIQNTTQNILSVVEHKEIQNAAQYISSEAKHKTDKKSTVTELSNFPCFKSHYFQNAEVIDVLYNYFVAKENTKGRYFQYISKSEFGRLFTSKKFTDQAVKLNWVGFKTGLRFFLISIQKIFEIEGQHIEIFKIAEYHILYRGMVLKYSDEFHNVKNPSKNVKDKISNMMAESQNQFTARATKNKSS